MIRRAVMRAAAASAAKKSINILRAGAVTALRQEPAVLTGVGADGTHLARRQKLVRRQVSRQRKNRVTGDIDIEL